MFLIVVMLCTEEKLKGGKDIKGKLKKEKRVYLIMGKMVGEMETEMRDLRVLCDKCESPNKILISQTVKLTLIPINDNNCPSLNIYFFTIYIYIYILYILFLFFIFFS